MRGILRAIKRTIMGLIILFILIPVIAVGSAYAYVRHHMNETGLAYTEAVEDIIVDMVPDEGIVVYGQYYGPSKVYNFLEEVRYDPYNYIHKDHHCILQHVPQEYIKAVVTAFRIILLGEI